MQESWNLSYTRTYTKLGEIKQTVVTPLKLSKKKRVILTRLHIGHIQITHEFIMAKKRSRICSFYGTQLAVKNIMT